MQFANPTPLAARLVVASLPEQPQRWANVTAKATFAWAPIPRLLNDAVLPLLDEDTPSELGLRPRDNLPRRDEAFEVILLGHAYAPAGKPTPRCEVALSVGSERRVLVVHGDRQWERKLMGPRITTPLPFTTMPLTWERAFGGTVSVEVDVDSPLIIVEERNPAGRGFDPAPRVQGLAKHLRCPKPFPRYDETRLLPNVEDPARLISRWDDAPDPACWATLPVTSSLQALRMLDGTRATAGLYHRAAPGWVIALPPAGAPITCEHLTLKGKETLSLPRLRVWCDALAGGVTSTHELRPQMLLIEPDAQRLSMTYRAWFPLAKPDGGERGARLRITDGWWGDA